MPRHWRPLGALTLVVVACLLVGTPAVADEYPSWSDVENARQNEASTSIQIGEIQGYLVQLESDAAALGRTAQTRGEEYNVAAQALGAASIRADKLNDRAKDAAALAIASHRRASQLIAQMARAGGGDLTTTLLLAPDGGDLLDALGTMSKLTQHSALIVQQATTDENTARSLTDQAVVAQNERKTLAADAQKALDDANAAAAVLTAQVASQQAAVGQLYDQLASLKGTTADLERQYIEGISAPTPGSPAPGNPAPANPSPGNPSPGNPAPGNPAPGNPDPVPGTPAPDPAPPTPVTSSVEAAIAFAYAQLGDRYEYGGSGPDDWDCSGLTQAAYRAAGVNIGAHGATSQYNYLASLGRLVPFSQIQRGDLIFYSDDGYTKYHTALYIGGGQMIEAQYEGVPVKVSSVRYWDLVGYVGRPTG